MKPQDRNSLEDLLRVLPLLAETYGDRLHDDIQEMIAYWLKGSDREPWGACAVVEQHGLVLAVMGPKGLGLPGGKGSPGEAPQACALRELHEETGLVVTKHHMLPASYAKGVLTYAVIVDEYEGQLKDSAEGVPCWVTPRQLLDSPFSRFPEYNAWVLKISRILPEGEKPET